MILKRVFHPVGHGAFYTERFYDDNQNIANIVFDCGCYESCKPGKSIADFRKQINDIVDNEFPLNEDDKIKVDALFISHFHEDHINGIKRLLNNCDVQRIITPKLTDDAILELLLYKWFKTGSDFEDIINNFEDFMQSIKNKKIELDFHEDYLKGDIEYETLDIGNLIDSICKPTIIMVCGIWKYIPFSTNEKTSQLRHALIAQVNKLAPILSVSPIDFRQIAKEFTKKKSLLEDCKLVYESIFGNQKHNRYSLTLFSGTCDNTMNCPQFCHQGIKDLPRHCSKNCLYMGDFEADPKKSLINTNCQQLIHFYHSYWDKIGILQVPHHGSHDNMNVNLYKPAKLAVISAGMTDVNGHPHKELIDELHKYQCIPLIVTEQETTVQKFTYAIQH